MKHRNPYLKWLCCSTLASVAISASIQAAPTPTHREVAHRTDRLIVKLRVPSGTDEAQAQRANADRVLTAASGMPMKHVRRSFSGLEIMQLPRALPVADVEAMAAVIAQDPNVEYAEPDYFAYPAATPNDPDYSAQWALGTDSAGMNILNAWDITTGSADIVIAVIDSGTRPSHKDLKDRLISGYDFISSDSVDGETKYYTANDGDGRDSDSSDPGDWVTAAENFGSTAGGFLAGCGTSDSSWHGTHVAGIIGATTNNGEGISGINWASPIMPVRVLGKCGGYISDIADAVRWAAGLKVSGVPSTTTPAKVLNLSLSRPGSCSKTEQSAINAAIAEGATVVIAAGNNGSDSQRYAPGNCDNVIAVAATGRDGASASYSNLGDTVDISAPGGDNYGILSTLNTGETTPESDTYGSYVGTSMAAAQVTGVVSLMLSINPDLTPAEVEEILIKTASPMGDGTCQEGAGAGLINAYAAVNAAQKGEVASLAAVEDNCAEVVLANDGSDASDNTSGGGGGGGSLDMTWLALLIPVAAMGRRRAIHRR
jgi:serine protease